MKKKPMQCHRVEGQTDRQKDRQTDSGRRGGPKGSQIDQPTGREIDSDKQTNK